MRKFKQAVWKFSIRIPVTSFGLLLIVIFGWVYHGQGQCTTARTLPVSEGFNAATITSCWSQQPVLGGASVGFTASSTDPATTPQEGSHYAFFNSYFISAGSETRLVTPKLTSASVTYVIVEFFWFNSNNPNWAYADEGMQLQYSFDNVNWTNAATASFVQRHDGTLPPYTGRWKKKSIVLAAAAGNKATLYIGFKFHSSYGENMSLDNVRIYAGCTTTPPVPDLTYSISPDEIAVNWPAVTGASRYEYAINSSSTAPTSGIVSTINTSFLASYSSVLQPYVHVRSVCPNGLTSAWKTSCLAVPGIINGPGDTCLKQTISLSIPNSLSSQEYYWHRDGFYVSQQTGTGGTLQYNAPINGAYQNGIYSVVTYKAGCEIAEFGNAIVAFNYPDNLVISNISSDSANFRWNSAGAGVTYEYAVTSSESPPANGIFTTFDSAVVTNLAPNTSYYFHVRASCPNSAGYNAWNTKQFFTQCIQRPAVPDLSVTADMVNAQLSAAWNPVANASKYEYAITLSNTPPTGGIATSSTSQNFALSQTDLQFVHVRSVCGNDTYSDWTTKFDIVPGKLKLNGVIDGVGGFCKGAVVDVQVEKTIRGQSYIWLLNGSELYNSGPKDGNGNGQSYAFVMNEFAPGSYSVEVSVAGAGAKIFGNVGVSYKDISDLKVTAYTATSLSFTWTGPASQYFVSTLSTPPGNGITITGDTITVHGLSANTKYYIHVKCPDCNWQSISFYTRSLPINCSSASTISACAPVVATIQPGIGAWDFEGIYPYNSTGFKMPGRETVYKFIAPATGIFYIEFEASDGQGAVFYKKESSGCSNTGWTAAGHFFDYKTIIPIGLLEKDSSYFVLLDMDEYSTANQAIKTFKICKATVATPQSTNSCNELYSAGAIPANSTKEEYFIDNGGSLIASMNFSNVSIAPNYVNLKYYVNTDEVRRQSNVEILDRNYSISQNPLATGAITRLYFTNAELQRLINEPNDGIADVASIGDLSISRSNEFCNGVSWQSELLNQTGNGALDANASYVQFVNTGNGTFYLHKGPAAVTGVDGKICPGGGLQISAPSLGTGYNYQWQVNDGSGFVNISNGGQYWGANTNSLYFSSLSSSSYGFEYRCIATNGSNEFISTNKKLVFITTWTGLLGTDWNNHSNWSCGQVPDANTDVIIDNKVNLPVITSNVSCRSILARPGAKVTIAPGVILTVTGKQ